MGEIDHLCVWIDSGDNRFHDAYESVLVAKIRGQGDEHG
jgi:hypothetical protein